MNATGQLGEDLAAQYLRAHGFSIRHRNMRLPGGEIDIVAVAPDGTLAVVEVKARRSEQFGGPLAAITPAKYRRLRQLTARYLQLHPHPGQVRIDVVGVVLLADRAELTHVAGVQP